MKGQYHQKTTHYASGKGKGRKARSRSGYGGQSTMKSHSAMGGGKKGDSSGGSGSRHQYAMGGHGYQPVAGMLTHEGKVVNQAPQAASTPPSM